METFFSLVCFIDFLCLLGFIFGIGLILFSKTETSKNMGKKWLLYSVITFIIGFGTCIGAILIVD